MTKHPWVYGVAVGLVFACLYVTLVFRGSAFTRISVGAVIGLFWGVTQGAAASHRRQRAAQQQDAATWTPPIASHPMPPRPSTRYRTAVVAEGLAVTGAVVAATNAAALMVAGGRIHFPHCDRDRTEPQPPRMAHRRSAHVGFHPCGRCDRG